MPLCSDSSIENGMCFNCSCDGTRGFKDWCDEDDTRHIKCEFKDDKESLYKAVIDKDLNKVKEILKNKNFDINQKSWYRGFTALHFAFLFMNKEILILILEKGADVNIKNNSDKTAIDLCKIEEYKSLINQFLEMKNFSEDFENNFETKISNIFDNDVDSKQEKSIINLLNQFKTEHNIKKIDTKILNHFEQKFINNIEFENEKYSILHIAVLKDMKKLIEYLIKKWPIDIDYKDNSGNSPWNYACLLLNKKIAFFLKKENQLNENDKIFLEDNINLSKEGFANINDINTQNRKDILDYYIFNKPEISPISCKKIKLINESEHNQPSTSGYQPGSPQM